jgi:hypothetical protein
MERWTLVVGMVFLVFGVLAFAIGLISLVIDPDPGLISLLFVGVALLAMGVLTLMLDVVSTWSDSIRQSLR